MIHRLLICAVLFFPVLCGAAEPGIVMQWYATAQQNFYPILAVIFCIWFWNRFMRLRCPECGTPHPRLFKVEECDSWLTPKKINEQRSLAGRPRKTSFTKVSRTYICSSCRKQWSVVSDK